MASTIDHCNMALAQLGDERIESFEEGTRRATLCALLYPSVRDALLCEAPWKFARQRQTLGELVPVPVSGYAHRYQLPTHPYCLQVLSLNGEDRSGWTVEGRELLTDARVATIQYSARIEDTGAFEGAFVLALVDRLTAQLGYSLTGDPEVEKVYVAKAQATLQAAQLSDLREESLLASPLELANLALAQLGEPRLTSFTENDRRATLAALYYARCRDSLLCEGQWKFARKRAALRATTAPVWGFASAYDLPMDCLQVRAMAGDDVSRWQVEGRTLVTDAPTAEILYVRQVTDVTLFDPDFSMALVEYLASEFAYTLTQKPDLQQLHLARYQAALAKAAAAVQSEESLIPSDLGLANLALAQLGESPIPHWRDNTRRATLAALFYPKIRDALLRQGHWKFARRRAVLSAALSTPSWGYDYAYALPADCLQVLHLDDDDLDTWAVEGRHLLNDNASVNITYIARVTDVTEFDSEFTMALVNALARQLAYGLTGNTAAAQLNDALYTESLREARHANAREGSPQHIPHLDLFTRGR